MPPNKEVRNVGQAPKDDPPPHRAGLVHAVRLDKAGGGRAAEWVELDNDPLGSVEVGDLWVHLDRTVPKVREWLIDTARVPKAAAIVLLADDPRPRYTRYPATETTPDGFLIVLRGVNLNPDSRPEDMVSVRLWVDEHRVISLRRRVVMAVRELRDNTLKGTGPRESTDLVIQLIRGLLERIDPVVDALDRSLFECEEHSDARHVEQTRDQISDLRRQTIRLRRFIAPQREAFDEMQTDLPDWFELENAQQLRGLAQRTSRIIEDLDELHGRASIAHDELSIVVAERMGRVSTRLTVVAMVFLPMTLLASLWGMNLPGMPLEGNPNGFWIALSMMLVLSVLLYFLSDRFSGR